MPTFDFRCPACNHQFEQSIPFGSKEYPLCTECGAQTEKLLSPPLGIVFKGQGFYKTDSIKNTQAPNTKSQESSKAEKSEEKKAADAPKDAPKPSKSTDSMV